MAREEEGEENGRGRDLNAAAESQNPTTIYLVYAKLCRAPQKRNQRNTVKRKSKTMQ